VLRNANRRTALLIAGVLALAMSAGCATYRMVQSAEKLEAAEDWDKAVLTYAKLAAQYPQDTRYTISLARTKFRASQSHFQKAKKFLTNKQTELAIGELQQAVVLDPTNAFAQTELEKALRQWQLERLSSEATEMERMKEIASKSSSVPACRCSTRARTSR
jgi:tetratricopeptide (TPR) repeat protein